MKITLNGGNFEHPRLMTITELLDIKNVHGGRLAVMVNDAIIKKDQFAETQIAEGDRVEIIHMVGGG